MVTLQGALISMDSIKSQPHSWSSDRLCYLQKDTNKIKCLNTSDEDYAKVRNQWSDKVVKLFDTFPRFDWEI